ncbi:MAG: hypothetical protein JWO62_2494 [Acidimicrobiaceae bacterium]|nr:hypothetical protein [Acidimicrobiaceae bacterium]
MKRWLGLAVAVGVVMLVLVVGPPNLVAGQARAGLPTAATLPTPSPTACPQSATVCSPTVPLGAPGALILAGLAVVVGASGLSEMHARLLRMRRVSGRLHEGFPAFIMRPPKATAGLL